MFEMEILFLLGVCPEVELLNILVVLLSNFLENSILFYIVAIFIYMPINSVKDSLFSTSSPPLISYPFDIAILTSVRLSYYCFCHTSVCSSVLCLFTTKIWSDRH